MENEDYNTYEDEPGDTPEQSKVKRKMKHSLRQIYYGAQPLIYGQQYWYVLGFTHKGVRIFWGPMSEEDAYKALGELEDGERFELKTRDAHRAVREVRDILIKRGEDPDETLRKLLHKREGEEEPSKESPPSNLFAGRLRASPRKLSILDGVKAATKLPGYVSRKLSGGD